MTKRRKPSPRPRATQKTNWGFWLKLLLGLTALGLVILYIIPVLFTVAAIAAGYIASKQPRGSRWGFGLASAVAAIVALVLFPQRATQLRAEETTRVKQAQLTQQRAEAAQRQAQQAQAARAAQAQAAARIKKEQQRQAAIKTEQSKPGLRGVVVSVTDGDTIRVKLSNGKLERVRLLGIDAPEIKQQDWGRQAKKALQYLVGNSSVRLTQDREKRDRNGRLLAYVWRGSSLVNYQLVRQGVADLYPTKVNVQYMQSLRQGLNEARAAKRGIWDTTNGLEVSPSAFRNNRCPLYGDQTGLQPTTKALSDGFDCDEMKKYTFVSRGSAGQIITASPRVAAPEPEAASTLQNNNEVYFGNCAAARAAGAAPIMAGEPGYRAGLDRDNDGVACE
jgi:micrococcal nuclease